MAEAEYAAAFGGGQVLVELTLTLTNLGHPQQSPLLKDGNEATDWYCAQVVNVLPTHVLVHYYTTATPALGNYPTASLSERDGQISQAIFLKTWSILGSGGYATTEPPKGIRNTRDIWSGKIKMCDLQDHLLVRNVELDDQGRLSIATVLLASKLKYPHHQSSGGMHLLNIIHYDYL